MGCACFGGEHKPKKNPPIQKSRKLAPSSERDLIQLCIDGDTERVKMLLNKLPINEIVHMRGHVLEDVNYRFERADEQSTEMWNPLLFAVHVGSLDLVQLLVERATHTPLICLMKPCAENETDDKNVRSFPEDKIYALLIAYEK